MRNNQSHMRTLHTVDYMSTAEAFYRVFCALPKKERGRCSLYFSGERAQCVWQEGLVNASVLFPDQFFIPQIFMPFWGTRIYLIFPAISSHFRTLNN